VNIHDQAYARAKYTHELVSFDLKIGVFASIAFLSR